MDDDDRPDSIMRGDPDPVPGRQLPPLSTAAKVAAVVGLVSMLAAGGINWASSQEPDQPSVYIKPTPSESRTIASAGGKKAADRAPARPGDDKPPKVILDFIEYSEPGCDSPRRVGVNVIEQQGIIDSVKVVWRAEELNLERGRTLFKKDEMWSVYLSYIPHNVKVQLLAIAEGPKGTTTLGKDISRYCDEDEE
ncbi:MAG: hypothetical protein KDC39_04505 [Actinobacteria bacterium]|nr:hypothetical protein [Actinomycetota bacterium]